MRKALFFFWIISANLGSIMLVAQSTTTRKEPKPYNPPLPNQPAVKMTKPLNKDGLTNTPMTANSSFSGISPTASPEIAQANFLQDVPVNKYTGTPIVKVPLYGIQEGKLAVSLGMNYNASGIRGHQLSGWSGLGWDLEGIPMITRIVRGLPDEGKFEATSLNSSVERKGYYSNGYIGATGANDDKEPDYFFFNMGGASFKFAFNPYGQAYFFPDADMKVSVATTSSWGSSVVKKFLVFNVTMPDGTKYEFTNDNSESTTEVEVGYAQSNNIFPSTGNFFSYLKTNQVTSAWYCSKIISPDGQQINFTYGRVLYSYYKLADNQANTNCPSSVTKQINRVFVQGASISQIEGIHTVIKFNDGNTVCTTYTDPETGQDIEYCYLTGIPNREDIDDWSYSPNNGSNAKILKNMVVYDKDHPTEKMTWSFDYGYFAGTDNSGYDLPSGYTYNGSNPVGHTHKKRLKLSTIHYPDGNQSDFKYYGEESGFNFKTRFTYGIDHWGFINGWDGNIAGYGLIGNDYLGSCGASRDTDIAFLKYGSLEKITHSAGAEIYLEYEAHKAKNYNSGNTDIGGLRIKKMRTKDLLRNTDILKEYAYTNSGQSTGFLFIKPLYRFDDYNTTRYTNSALYEILTAESGRPSVGYSQVTETVYDLNNTAQVGKTISYYDQDETELKTEATGEYCYYDQETGTLICTPTTTYYLDSFIPKYDYRGGSLIKEENYNQSNQKLSEVNMIYTPNNGIASDSMYCQRVVRLNGVNQSKYYYLKISKYRLEQTTAKIFSEDGTGTPQTTTTDFVYKDEMPQAYKDTYKGKHNQLVKTITTDSYGYTIESLNKYVADFNFDVDSTLMCEPDCYPQSPCPEPCKYWNVTDHVPASGTEARGIYDMRLSKIGLPVETITKRNNKTISASYQTYSVGLPIQSYLLRTVPKTNFSEVVFQKSTDLMLKDGGYGSARSEVLSYNLYGLPILIETKRGTTSQVLYDYRNILPIAKTSNYGITDAFTTTYEYNKVFQGVSKETAPNNLELRYNYRSTDSRLLNIKDKDDKILKKRNYQVKPQ